MEREDNFRLKRFKELKLKKAGGGNQNKKVCIVCKTCLKCTTDEIGQEKVESCPICTTEELSGPEIGKGESLTDVCCVPDDNANKKDTSKIKQSKAEGDIINVLCPNCQEKLEVNKSIPSVTIAKSGPNKTCSNTTCGNEIGGDQPKLITSETSCHICNSKIENRSKTSVKQTENICGAFQSSQPSKIDVDLGDYVLDVRKLMDTGQICIICKNKDEPQVTKSKSDTRKKVLCNCKPDQKCKTVGDKSSETSCPCKKPKETVIAKNVDTEVGGYVINVRDLMESESNCKCKSKDEKSAPVSSAVSSKTSCTCQSQHTDKVNKSNEICCKEEVPKKPCSCAKMSSELKKPEKVEKKINAKQTNPCSICSSTTGKGSGYVIDLKKLDSEEKCYICGNKDKKPKSVASAPLKSCSCAGLLNAKRSCPLPFSQMSAAKESICKCKSEKTSVPRSDLSTANLCSTCQNKQNESDNVCSGEEQIDDLCATCKEESALTHISKQTLLQESSLCSLCRQGSQSYSSSTNVFNISERNSICSLCRNEIESDSNLSRDKNTGHEKTRMCPKKSNSTQHNLCSSCEQEEINKNTEKCTCSNGAKSTFGGKVDIRCVQVNNTLNCLESKNSKSSCGEKTTSDKDKQINQLTCYICGSMKPSTSHRPEIGPCSHKNPVNNKSGCSRCGKQLSSPSVKSSEKKKCRICKGEIKIKNSSCHEYQSSSRTVNKLETGSSTAPPNNVKIEILVKSDNNKSQTNNNEGNANTSGNTDNLKELLNHIDKVMNFTKQFKSQGLTSESVDNLFNACKEAKSDLIGPKTSLSSPICKYDYEGSTKTHNQSCLKEKISSCSIQSGKGLKVKLPPIQPEASQISNYSENTIHPHISCPCSAPRHDSDTNSLVSTGTNETVCEMTQPEKDPSKDDIKVLNSFLELIKKCTMLANNSNETCMSNKYSDNNSKNLKIKTSEPKCKCHGSQSLDRQTPSCKYKEKSVDTICSNLSLQSNDLPNECGFKTKVLKQSSCPCKDMIIESKEDKNCCKSTNTKLACTCKSKTEVPACSPVKKPSCTCKVNKDSAKGTPCGNSSQTAAGNKKKDDDKSCTCKDVKNESKNNCSCNKQEGKEEKKCSESTNKNETCACKSKKEIPPCPLVGKASCSCKQEQDSAKGTPCGSNSLSKDANKPKDVRTCSCKDIKNERKNSCSCAKQEEKKCCESKNEKETCSCKSKKEISPCPHIDKPLCTCKQNQDAVNDVSCGNSSQIGVENKKDDSKSCTCKDIKNESKNNISCNIQEEKEEKKCCESKNKKETCSCKSKKEVTACPHIEKSSCSCKQNHDGVKDVSCGNSSQIGVGNKKNDDGKSCTCKDIKNESKNKCSCNIQEEKEEKQCCESKNKKETCSCKSKKEVTPCPHIEKSSCSCKQNHDDVKDVSCGKSSEIGDGSKKKDGKSCTCKDIKNEHNCNCNIQEEKVEKKCCDLTNKKEICSNKSNKEVTPCSHIEKSSCTCKQNDDAVKDVSCGNSSQTAVGSIKKHNDKICTCKDIKNESINNCSCKKQQQQEDKKCCDPTNKKEICSCKSKKEVTPCSHMEKPSCTCNENANEGECSCKKLEKKDKTKCCGISHKPSCTCNETKEKERNNPIHYCLGKSSQTEKSCAKCGSKLSKPLPLKSSSKTCDCQKNESIAKDECPKKIPPKRACAKCGVKIKPPSPTNSQNKTCKCQSPKKPPKCPYCQNKMNELETNCNCTSDQQGEYENLGTCPSSKSNTDCTCKESEKFTKTYSYSSNIRSKSEGKSSCSICSTPKPKAKCTCYSKLLTKSKEKCGCDVKPICKANPEPCPRCSLPEPKHSLEVCFIKEPEKSANSCQSSKSSRESNSKISSSESCCGPKYKDASTETRRTDRYDVRSLLILRDMDTDVHKQKCVCTSEPNIRKPKCKPTVRSKSNHC